jgi:hypothetical protein
MRPIITEEDARIVRTSSAVVFALALIGAVSLGVEVVAFLASLFG